MISFAGRIQASFEQERHEAKFYVTIIISQSSLRTEQKKQMMLQKNPKTKKKQ
jgi:hypothetical protein